jgi:DNA-binding transcriptional regulator YhcF (GntR family)
MFGQKRREVGRYNFSDAIRRAQITARSEAVRLKHDAVGPEHLLLGLLADEATAALLREHDVDRHDLRAAVEARIPPGDVESTMNALPDTFRAKKVLELTLADARERDDPCIGTENLLRALMREGGTSATLLREHGLSLATDGGITVSDETRTPQFRVLLDDESERSIYEQIVAQVTEAVATGALRAGDRLPTVRRLADDLEIAPGTVARAYGELERQSVVVTEGARGTRVASQTRPDMDATQRQETLIELLRPVAVAAFHLGARAPELRNALNEAMRDIFDSREPAA